jgi:hypothetical protein
VWRPTFVTFIDTDGNEEDGQDSGGLTVEAHSAFWREVCSSNLFSNGLPAPGAPHEKLVGVGRMLAKSLCDDHVTGSGLARFALEYVVHGPTGRALSSPRLALEALSECDAELAQRWRRCVQPRGSLAVAQGWGYSCGWGQHHREANPRALLRLQLPRRWQCSGRLEATAE